MIRKFLTHARRAACSAALVVCVSARAHAADADDTFSVMQVLAEHGQHELRNERWNAYGQFTWISSWKAPFFAPYTNLNGANKSLSANGEHSFTATATLFLGLGLWRGAELYFVPEAISSRPLSNLSGLGGSIQNFELQKQGQLSPTVYRSRTYLTQTIGLGGRAAERPSGPMQLGSTVDSHRLVFVVGNFSVLDFFDRNSVIGDPRRQFFNIAFLAHAAYDFAGDSRGYSWGALFELHWDDWVARGGRFAPPRQPNQLAIDFRFYKYYADQIEFEHAHRVAGQPGVVRLLGFRNHENMGGFADAAEAFQSDQTKNAAACEGLTYGSQDAVAPDLCWARKPRTKFGLGISFEQQVTDGIGVFGRAMVSDGRSEVYSYTSADRSASIGAVVHGAAWRRRYDALGSAFAAGFISPEHAQYLKLGGVDGFIGDGKLQWASERVFEVFYRLNVHRSLSFSADYQHISNPGYNADRGPVDVLSGRVHAEF
ncbi:MAG: carbohydrate porin [Polyangiaceae bacterium]